MIYPLPGLWQPTPMLRVAITRVPRPPELSPAVPAPTFGDEDATTLLSKPLTAIGTTSAVLEQLWCHEGTSQTEWRPVPVQDLTPLDSKELDHE